VEKASLQLWRLYPVPQGGRKEEERRKKGGRKEARVGNAEFGMPIFLCVSAPLREVPL
jgi:hypothetical protein